MLQKVVQILLVEDDDIDAESIERAFQHAKISNPLSRARDGVEAFQMLRGEDGKPRLPRPYLILLDLKMPRMNGLQFLEKLREDPELANSVVFVLTTSRAESDKLAAYKKFVAGYIVKTNVGEDFAKLIGLLNYYWQVVEPPPNRS